MISIPVCQNGCYCGGGGKEQRLNAVAGLGRNLTDADQKNYRITEWLKSRSDIKEWRIGDVFDIWHGDYEDTVENESCGS